MQDTNLSTLLHSPWFEFCSVFIYLYNLTHKPHMWLFMPSSRFNLTHFFQGRVSVLFSNCHPWIGPQFCVCLQWDKRRAGGEQGRTPGPQCASGTELGMYHSPPVMALSPSLSQTNSLPSYMCEWSILICSMEMYHWWAVFENVSSFRLRDISRWFRSCGLCM